MRPNFRLLLITLAAIMLLLAVACNETGSQTNSAGEGIPIGVVFPFHIDEDTDYRKGLELAFNEINANGGLNGRTLDPVYRDDRDDTQYALQIAETFCEQNISAVIGHWSTSVCYFTEDIYEQNGVVMITPSATGTNLFESEYNYIFQMTPDNGVYAESFAERLESEDVERVAIYYNDNSYGRNFAGLIESSLAARGIVVVDRVYNVTAANADEIFDRWTAFGVESLIVAALCPEIIEPIVMINEHLPHLNIYGADNLVRSTFQAATSHFSDKISIASYSKNEKVAAFEHSFTETYGHSPDLHAIAAYETVYLLYAAMSNGTDAADIASYLKQLSDYEALSGVISYDADSQSFVGFNVSISGIEG